MQSKQSREYMELLNSIPGGVLQSANDADFTVLEVNRGFLDMFGFSLEEISRLFHNRFAQMIHPCDRQEVHRKIAVQLKAGDSLELQYRVLCKNGSFKWVMENGRLIHDGSENTWLMNVLMDITESRNAREELRLSLERHQIILNQTADIIFEWNIAADNLIYSGNWIKKFGYEAICNDVSVKIPEKSHIHPDDLPVFMELMENARGGSSYSTAVMRIQNSEGRFIWCRIRATDQYDDLGKPIKTIGVITDIDEEKRMIDELRQRAERDALTGLYNREEMERQIRRELEDNPNEICALLMIDTDNFKGVNDKQGHLFGDAVLSELAAGMKRLTRNTDVVGRIGGDEFTILLKSIPSKEVAAQKAAQLLDMFQHLFQQSKKPVEVTCSAGVAIFPEDGNNFQSLYHSADIALYQAKSMGKNQYVLYDKEQEISIDQTGYSALGASIDSDNGSSGSPGDLISYVFQVLYNSSDIDHVIQLILEIIGKRFDVSRAYVFENSEDGAYCSNTYEWCNEGIIPQKEHLQCYPYEAVQGYRDLFKDNAVFYCCDIRSLTPVQAAMFESQGIRSTLQCAIQENNVFHGFVGFDECTGIRMWTKEEISILSLISQLLTTFLLKKRVTDRDQELVVRLNTILNTQDAYIYAIEKNTHELLYLNHKTRELDPGAKTGMTCYGAFFARENPCDNCPLTGGGGEIYNPRYNVWTRTKAAPMKWGAIDAYLLTCFDISDYKQIQE